MDHRGLQGTAGTSAHRPGVGRIAIGRVLVEHALPGLAALLGLTALALLLCVLALRASVRQAWGARGREGA
jgi:hypothetical protein